jgi:uncharacterized integral membrane protein
VATRSGSKGESGTADGGRATNGRAPRRTNGRGATAAATTDGKTVTASATDGKGATATVTNGKNATAGADKGGRRRPGARATAASATGATARARLGSTRRSGAGAAGRRKVKDDIPIVDPTVPADDDVLAASNARRALNPDMPRVAWLRSQLNQMEARQRERLFKAVQLTVIAIVFITFVLQNAQPVDVHFLFFALNIRLIWVIFGCALLGGAAGYLVGRPEKSLRAMFPPRDKKATRGGTSKV